jgi:hypothetical protein
MQARVVVLTADPAFEESVRSTFSASPQIAASRLKAPPSSSLISTPAMPPNYWRWNA